MQSQSMNDRGARIRERRWTSRVVRFLPSIAVLFGLLLVPYTAEALNGRIVGKTGRAKAFVRVENGKNVVYTDKKGDFSIALPKGEHRLYIRDGKRTIVFKTKVTDPKDKTIRLFRLNWK